MKTNVTIILVGMGCIGSLIVVTNKLLSKFYLSVISPTYTYFSDFQIKLPWNRAKLKCFITHVKSDVFDTVLSVLTCFMVVWVKNQMIKSWKCDFFFSLSCDSDSIKYHSDIQVAFLRGRSSIYDKAFVSFYFLFYYFLYGWQIHWIVL